MIRWFLWRVYDDGTRSLMDFLDWAPHYDRSARDAFAYVWSGWKAYIREGGYEIVTEGRG